MVTFEHRVAGTTTPSVFQTIDEWLRSEKAKVKQSQFPVFITASHGRALQPMGWKKDARKTITFYIAQDGPDVMVKAEFKPAALNASDVNSRMDQARANWNELLSGLWYSLGDTEAPQRALTSPPVDWNRSLRRANSLIYSGTILFTLGLIATILLISTVGVIFSGLMVVGILSLINGAMNRRSAKKRLEQQ